MWVAYAKGWPQGFFMLDWREAGICDLAYFGLVPEAVGAGLGGLAAADGACKGLGAGGRDEDDGEYLHARPSRARWASTGRWGFVPVRTVDRTRILCRDRNTSLHPA
jgi:hypothetical protein